MRVIQALEQFLHSASRKISRRSPDWENLFYDCGGAAGVLISSVQNPELKQFEGKTVTTSPNLEKVS